MQMIHHRFDRRQLCGHAGKSATRDYGITPGAQISPPASVTATENKSSMVFMQRRAYNAQSYNRSWGAIDQPQFFHTCSFSYSRSSGVRSALEAAGNQSPTGPRWPGRNDSGDLAECVRGEECWGGKSIVGLGAGVQYPLAVLGDGATETASSYVGGGKSSARIARTLAGRFRLTRTTTGRSVCCLICLGRGKLLVRRCSFPTRPCGEGMNGVICTDSTQALSIRDLDRGPATPKSRTSAFM